MKVLVVALAIVACVSAEDWVPKNVEQIKAIRAECIAANPVPAEYSEKFKTFEYPDVESVRKYIQCNAEKIGVFCEHEGYHIDRVAKQFKLKLDEAEATAIAQTCYDKNEQKDSADVWAYRGHVCFMGTKLGENIKNAVKQHKEAVKA